MKIKLLIIKKAFICAVLVFIHLVALGQSFTGSETLLSSLNLHFTDSFIEQISCTSFTKVCINDQPTLMRYVTIQNPEIVHLFQSSNDSLMNLTLLGMLNHNGNLFYTHTLLLYNNSMDASEICYINNELAMKEWVNGTNRGDLIRWWKKIFKNGIENYRGQEDYSCIQNQIINIIDEIEED